jgi:hypothetical protein
MHKYIIICLTLGFLLSVSAFVTGFILQGFYGGDGSFVFLSLFSFALSIVFGHSLKNIVDEYVINKRYYS